MRPRLAGKVWFAVPGDIATRTGGTIYDKRVMAELRCAGWTVEHLAWPGSFPFPTDADMASVAASLAACPDDALLLIDGLAFGAMPDLAAEAARRLRLVALVHHPLALETGLTPETTERLAVSERAALSHARAVIVTSDMTAGTLAADYGVPAGRITVAKPGVDRAGEPDNPTLDFSTSFPRRRESIVEQRDGGEMDSRLRGNDELNKSAIPHLLTVGTVTPRKGHDVLIAALAAIADLDWRCTIAGSLDRSPDTAAAIRAQIGRLNLHGRVVLTGEVAEPASLYRASDIFVLPSRYEGYGMAIAEALVHGLPVVATRVGAIPEVVPADAGILVPVDDAGALAGALRRLIEDPACREQMALAAQAAVFQSWVETARQVASALDAVQ